MPDEKLLNLHKCWGYLPAYEAFDRADFLSDFAIDECIEHPDGTLVAGQAGVGSQVAYCPFCGYEAKIKPPVVPYERDDDLNPV